MSGPYYTDEAVTLWHGDALSVLRSLPDASVNCCVTSPPYFGLRDYGVAGQYGLEATPAAYVEQLREVGVEIRRVLADDGTLWLNIADSYAGKANAGATFDRHRGHGHLAGIIAPQRNMLSHAPYKSLLGVPARLSLALIDDGWTLRSDVIWHKPNGMPESVDDRLTCDYEHVFLLTKGPSYWFDLEPIREPLTYPQDANGKRHFGQRAPEGVHGSTYGENHYSKRVTTATPAAADRYGTTPASTLGQEQLQGRNPGSVWDINTVRFPEAHFAAMPPALARRCIAAGCRPGGIVLDPFSGSGTTRLAQTALLDEAGA